MKRGKKGHRINFKPFMEEIPRKTMTEIENKSAKEYSDNLTKLGKEIYELQFNYKLIEKDTEQYWQRRISEFKKYSEKTIEYFTLAHKLMNLTDKENSGLFLLMISKLHQIGLKLIANMEEVKQNPSVMKSKDKQQSKWSKELREETIESNNECMNQEIKMNRFFRTFYEKNIRNKLE